MRKYYILCVAAIGILSNLLCINNESSFVSALSYQSEVGIGFTFNPTISISLSSSNLDISNLMPGNTLDSNIINVSVSSNNANGYTMFATAGNAEHNNTNLNHSNNTDTFNSIPTNANLASLTTDNTWGYTTSLDNGSTWSNYNGLSLYTDTGTTLINKLGLTESSIDFKIAARASNTQASGTYNNVINFIAITRPNPISLEDAYSSYYLSTGKTKHNGYYIMQDMNSTICNNVELLDSELQVIDIRDDKVYWIAKLRDGHCWMTQNLDFNITTNTTLNSETTDLNVYNISGYYDGYSKVGDIIYWEPINNATTINFTTDTVPITNWQNSNILPYSARRTNAIHTGHASIGNHYNWTIAIASNNSNTFTSDTLNNPSQNPQNSICSKGWRLPTISNQSETIINSNNEFSRLISLYNNGWTIFPLWFITTGYIANGSLFETNSGRYWSSTNRDINSSYGPFFNSSRFEPNTYGNRAYGRSIRCLAR